MPRTAKAIAADIQGLVERADSEGRDWTPDEREQVQGLLDDATAQRDIEHKMKALDGTLSAGVLQPGGDSTHGGPGDRFIASKGYQRVKDSASRSQTWSTGPVEVSSHMLVKGTMLETGVGGPGGGPVPPHYEPGIVPKLLEPLGVRDVFGQSTTNASQVRYVNEALRVNRIDLDANVIRVEKGWDVKAGEIATKNGKDRNVPITAPLRELLLPHLMRTGRRDDDLTFGATATDPFAPKDLTRRADEAWAALRRITLHECRHTFASYMIAAGVNAKAVSTYMGHASVSFTLDRYGHLFPGAEDEAAGLLDTYLQAAGGQGG